MFVNEVLSHILDVSERPLPKTSSHSSTSLHSHLPFWNSPCSLLLPGSPGPCTGCSLSDTSQGWPSCSSFRTHSSVPSHGQAPLLYAFMEVSPLPWEHLPSRHFVYWHLTSPVGCKFHESRTEFVCNSHSTVAHTLMINEQLMGVYLMCFWCNPMILDQKLQIVVFLVVDVTPSPCSPLQSSFASSQ